MAQPRCSTINRRVFLQFAGAFVMAVFLPRKQLLTPARSAPLLEDQTGVFPFDLGAALLESPAAQVIHYNDKIFKQFLPLIRR